MKQYQTNGFSMKETIMLKQSASMLEDSMLNKDLSENSLFFSNLNKELSKQPQITIDKDESSLLSPKQNLN